MTDPTQEIKQIRQQVEQRRAEEIAQTVETEGAPEGNGKITGKFIRECMLQCDAGDGLLYAKVNRGRFVYNSQSGTWFRWAGHSWTEDALEEHKTAVEDVVDVLLEETSVSLGRSRGH